MTRSIVQDPRDVKSKAWRVSTKLGTDLVLLDEKGGHAAQRLGLRVVGVES
jgi:predicted nucleic acid-binding protein